MDIFKLREQALHLEKDRHERITAVMQDLPKRKPRELSLLCTMVAQAHRTLCVYNLMPKPPAVAGITETWFDAALARVEEIKAAAQAEG